MKQAALLLAFATVFSAAQGETLYVSDQLKITMRGGESTKHKIVRMLSSGTPVEVLGRNSDTGYTRVRTQGTEGYVLSRQLMKEPSPREQLAELKQRLKALQEAPDQLQSKLYSLQQEHESLGKAHQELASTKERLKQELESIRATAADAVRINNERNELRKTVAELTRERENLKQENRDLNNQTAQNWFMIGAGVIIFGIILGLILPHLRFQRRKSSWGSL